MAVVGRGGIVGVVPGPGVGELAGGVDLAGEHVAQDLTADVAQLAQQHNGVDAVDRENLAHVDHTAQVEHQHELGIALG